MKPVKMIIGGDLAPTKTNFSLFEEGNIDALIDRPLIRILESADIRIFNLELPLTDTAQPIKKDGPNNKAPEAVIEGIKKLNPTVLSLANNHIMDHGDQGLFRTLDILSQNSIEWTGVGKDLSEASLPYVINCENLRIGIYSCAEHEFSIADKNKSGANPFDPLDSPDHISHLKSSCDYVIVLYHGGKELYRYPSPNLQKVCRKMADKGADLIVCQHSHCIGAYENYKNSVIVYGQGNFLFDRTDDEYWQTSLLIKVSLEKRMEIEYIPFRRSKPGITVADTNEAEKIMAELNRRSQEITVPGFIKSEYDRYCSINGMFYLGALAGFGRIVRKINTLSGGLLTRLIFPLKKMNMVQNFIECEAHRELLINYLDQKRND